MKRSHDNGNGGGAKGPRDPLDALWKDLSKRPEDEIDEIVAVVLSELPPLQVMVAYRHYGEEMEINDIVRWIEHETGRAPARSTLWEWRQVFLREFPSGLRRELDRRSGKDGLT